MSRITYTDFGRLNIVLNGFRVILNGFRVLNMIQWLQTP